MRDSVCEAAEGARKPEAVERRFIIRMADARKHAGCNSRDTIGASSIARSCGKPQCFWTQPLRRSTRIQCKTTAQVDQPRSKPDDGARPYQPRMRPSLRSRRKIFRGSIWAFLNRAARCSESSKRCRRRLPCLRLPRRRRRPHRRAAQFLVA